MKDIPSKACAVDAVLFDFGGVLAEEGFANGLRAIALKNGKAPDEFMRIGHELVHKTGFVTGRATEHDYWEAIRKKTGIRDDDRTLRTEILSRFILRPFMLDAVRYLRETGILVAILSDQTSWLDELNDRYDFFRFFDYVFNSYHMGRSKKDPAHFGEVLAAMGLEGEQVLLIDDRKENCDTARAAGLHAIQYENREFFYRDMTLFCPAFGRPGFAGRREGL
ncbi:MAG: HAD family hydrolase [Syntrophales bacterium]